MFNSISSHADPYGSYVYTQDSDRVASHLRKIVYTLFVASIVLVQIENPIHRAISIVMLLVAVGVLALVRQNAISIASHIVPMGLYITFTTYALTGDGIADPAVFGYTLVMIIAGLLLGQQGVLTFGGLGVLGIWMLFIAGERGHIDSVAITRSNHNYTTVTFITAYLILNAVVLRTIIQTLQTSIHSARHNAGALEKLNVELEKRVKERTKALHTSQQQTEILARIGKRINAGTSFTEILDSIVAETDALDFAVTLNIFENYERTDATYIQTVALLVPGQLTAQEMDLRTPILKLHPNPSGLLIVDDISNAPIREHIDFSAELDQPIRSLMSYDFTLGQRTIGTLTFTSETIRKFSDFEQHLIVGVGELAAAAAERSRLYTEQVTIAEEMRQLDNMKSQFLASMSHELRTPLNAILNFTEFLKMEMLGPLNDRQVDALSKALGSGRHLLSLINDILDITKIEAGMMHLFIEDNVNVEHEISTVLATTTTLLNNKGIKFETDIEPDLPVIVADKRRIRQVLLNLLSNAIKFTEVGSIKFRATAKDNSIFFVIADTGPGIAIDDQELIFEPFQQAESGIRHAGGTGLGLPITKRLVEGHGGRIWMESEQDVGTTFYVLIPVRSQELLAQIQTPEVTPVAK